MARLVRIFQTLRRHKKKTVFFSAVLGAAVHYGREKYQENEMMRQLCVEALSYGEASRLLGEADRHITVLLNPAAKDGKSKAAFEKYCAPLLHLAGVKVAVVRTEHEGQARDLMAIMEKTSAVVVAGGDGTLAEVLTGLLRREDSAEASRRLPLGVLPLGNTNSTASSLWGLRAAPRPLELAEATMAVLRDMRRSLDVMEITPIQGEGQVDSPAPVYAASEMVWGAFRDAAQCASKYWYWPGIKKYMTYVFSSYKTDLSWDCSAHVEYSMPCAGCNHCKPKKEPESTPMRPDTNRRWWMNYLPRQPTIQTHKQDEGPDYSLISNPSCGEKHNLTLDGVSELVVATCNTSHYPNTAPHALTLRTGQKNISGVEFIKEGWRREWGRGRSHVGEWVVGEITITPTSPTTNIKGEERELSIDNEGFEIRPMRIKPKPAAVTVFAPPRQPVLH